MTIYDLRVCLTWQKIHAYQFFDEADARGFAEMVEDRWIIHPGVNPTLGLPIWLVSNDAGCFVQSFNLNKFKHERANSKSD